MTKSPDAFRTISEVADWLGVQAHVLRFWESKFSQVKPVKRAGGRRYYRPTDMQLLGGIKKLLHDDGLTIKGVQKILREQGAGHVSGFSQPLEDGADTSAPDADATVLKFRASRAKPDEIEDAIEPDDQDGTAGEPEAAAALAAAPASEAISAQSPSPEEKTEAEPDTPPLPSFMHRPAAGHVPPLAEPEATPEPAAQPEPAARRAQVVDAPDPPEESALPYTPGVMAHLAKLDRLTPEQVSRIAPVARELNEWLTRASGSGAA